jgi:hypothetical protein
MPVLKYHYRTVEFLKITPEISEDALRVIANQESLCGRQMPTAVREWYSLVGATDLLRDFGNQDNPVPLQELWLPENVDSGFVYFLGENQGVWSAYIRLDGSDDPSVVASYDDWPQDPHSYAWENWGPFADFVFEWIRAGAELKRKTIERMERWKEQVRVRRGMWRKLW